MPQQQPTEREAPPWHRMASDEVLDSLDAKREGLGPEECRTRADEHGPNTIKTEQKVSPWKVLLDQFTSPMVYVLLGALVVTLSIQSWADAIVIGLVLVVNATIGFIQEYRAQSAVQSLMEMVSPKARVRRGGEEKQLPAEQLAPGDIVLLDQGEMAPADLRLLDCKALQVNEAALTGESVPSSKTADAMEDAGEDLPPADQRNMAFMGTAVTAGRGEGVVVAIGRQTQLGRIAEDIRAAGQVETPLQKRMSRLATWIAVAILIIAALAFGVGLWMGESVEQMFLLAVSLAVAAIPAGLPVVMTVALAIGVHRMARRNAVIRHLPAVETLGSTTAIVSDKTGTLTQNQMSVQEILAAGGERYEVVGEAFSREGRIERDGEPADAPEGGPLYYALLAGSLNNQAQLKDSQEETQGQQPDEPSEEPARDQELHAQGDPMEVALLISAAKAGLSRAELSERYPLVDEVPFQTEKRFSATIHNTPDGDGPLVLIKGAPERVLQMCSHQLGGDGQPEDLDRDAFERQNDDLAAQGLRVLAMAIGRGEERATSIKADEPEGMTFVGMQGLLDPPRPEAIDAVGRCRDAGIRVLMVTGDNARTAAAIAQKVGLGRGAAGDRPNESDRQGDAEAQPLPTARTGQELADLDDEQVDGLLEEADVFARVKPEHKVRIVERLKARGQVVAVTGDGVNDAPALKTAHLGAAMGQTGTDVAKEASDMVITDDNFASVYKAVEEGRTAFRNIRMATFFLLSTGAADILVILTALVLRWPLPLLPAQILWCNVVTNGIADVALGFEPGERALFRRPPRPISEGVLDRCLIERLVLVGVWLAAGTLGVFYLVYQQSGVDLARVAALTTLVLFQMVHVFNCRSEDVSIFKKSLLGNKVLLWGVLASLAVHVAALYIPWTQRLLSFEPLPWWIWGVSIGVAATAILVNEGHKHFRPRDKVNQETWPAGWLRESSRRERDEPGVAPAELGRRLAEIEDTTRENRELLEQVVAKSERRSATPQHHPPQEAGEP
ncbi:HAD-IC family P-type ATPase [Botrimarina sp.]|uniref:cation-translocating P-type ATPase n=1 Tax=Botrimarina sp. TaxID=2795802 RepID=UPI0032ECBBCB